MGMIENIRARGQIARARGAQTLRERLAIGRQLRSTPEGREEVRRVVEENRAAGRTRRIDATGGADRAAGQVRGWEKLVGARISTFLEAERAEAESIHKPQARDEALRRYDYLRIAAYGDWRRVPRKFEGADADRVQIEGFDGRSPILLADGSEFVASVSFRQTINVGSKEVVSTTMDVRKLIGVGNGGQDCRIEIPDPSTEHLRTYEPEVLGNGALRYSDELAVVYHDRMNWAMRVIDQVQRGTSPRISSRRV